MSGGRKAPVAVIPAELAVSVSGEPQTVGLVGATSACFPNEKVDKAMLELIQNSFWLRCLKLHGSTAGVDRIHSGLWVAEGRA